MPNLDGFGYCEKVRADKHLLRMPIIVQTALEDRNSRLRALSCGANDFLLSRWIWMRWLCGYACTSKITSCCIN